MSTTAIPGTGTAAGAAGLRGAARQGFANLVGAGVAAVAGFGLNIVVTRALRRSAAGVFFAPPARS